MPEILNQTLRLKSGCEIPVFGLGTWELVGTTCETIVRKALEMGYRHIDTAEVYENESEIGRAIKGVDRSLLFITSKVASSNLAAENVLNACQRSLAKLGTDYLDLYLIHWPNDAIALGETLEAMSQLVDEGMVRSIGLSNFDVRRIKQAMSVSAAPITNLQIEYHPFSPRKELSKFCRHEGITITAYSPLARGAIFDDPTLRKLAERYGKSPAQISLKWLLQKDNIVIPKASSQEHLWENVQMTGWQLSQQDIEEIDSIKSRRRLVDTTYT